MFSGCKRQNWSERSKMQNCYLSHFIPVCVCQEAAALRGVLSLCEERCKEYERHMAKLEHQLGEKTSTVDELHVRLEEVLQSRDELQKQLSHTQEILRRHSAAAPSQAMVRTAKTLLITLQSAFSIYFYVRWWTDYNDRIFMCQLMSNLESVSLL